MRRLKVPLSVIIVLLVFVDAVVAIHLWTSGWPKRVSLSDVAPGVAKVQVALIPFTATDWLILAAVITFHAVISCATWKAWRSGGVRV